MDNNYNEPMQDELYVDPVFKKIQESLERAGYIEDIQRLSALGFNQQEIQYFQQHVANLGALTNTKLASVGVQQNYIQLFIYMFKLSTYNFRDSVELTDPISLSTHLTKLFNYRCGNGTPSEIATAKAKYSVSEKMLPATGKYRELPRRAQIVGLPEDSKFDIYNSNNYTFYDRLYCIKPGTNISQTISILTDKQPKLAYREKREIPDVISIKGISDTGVTELAVNREYTKIHNVFYITVKLGKLRNEEAGKYGYAYLVAGDGTIITVYVSVWKPSTQSVKKVEHLRVCDIGYFDYELSNKVLGVAHRLAQSKTLNIKLVQCYPQSEPFEPFTDDSEDSVYIE